MKRKIKTINYLGMEGKGNTQTEAKADAMTKIAKALQLNFTPSFVSYGGSMAVVWETPWGTVSGYLHDDKQGLTGSCHHQIGAKIPEILDMYRMALAQQHGSIDKDEVPIIISWSESMVKDYAGWLGFQRACQAAPDKEPGARHKYACDNQGRFTPDWKKLKPTNRSMERELAVVMDRGGVKVTYKLKDWPDKTVYSLIRYLARNEALAVLNEFGGLDKLNQQCVLDQVPTFATMDELTDKIAKEDFTVQTMDTTIQK